MFVTPQAFDFPYLKSLGSQLHLYSQIYSFYGDIIIGTFIRDKWENRKTMNKGNIHDSLCLNYIVETSKIYNINQNIESSHY